MRWHHLMSFDGTWPETLETTRNPSFCVTIWAKMRCTIYTIFEDALFFFDKPKSPLKLGRSLNATPLSLPNEGKLLLLLSFPAAFSASPASKGTWNWCNPEAGAIVSYHTCYTSNINMPALFPQSFPISNPYTLQPRHNNPHNLPLLVQDAEAVQPLLSCDKIDETSRSSWQTSRRNQTFWNSLVKGRWYFTKKTLLEDSFWSYCRFKKTSANTKGGELSHKGWVCWIKVLGNRAMKSEETSEWRSKLLSVEERAWKAILNTNRKIMNWFSQLLQDHCIKNHTCSGDSSEVEVGSTGLNVYSKRNKKSTLGVLKSVPTSWKPTSTSMILWTCNPCIAKSFRCLKWGYWTL